MPNFRSTSIAGASAVVALSTGSPAPSGYVAGTQLGCRFVILNTPSGNATVLIGGAEVSSTVGYPMLAGQTLTIPVDGTDPTSFYDLSQMKAYIPTGSTLNVLYG